MKTKICTKCGIAKPISEFCKRALSKDGLSYRCKLCHNTDSKLWYLKNIQTRKLSMRKWNDAHPILRKGWRGKNLHKARKAQRKYRKNY